DEAIAGYGVDADGLELGDELVLEGAANALLLADPDDDDLLEAGRRAEDGGAPLRGHPRRSAPRSGQGPGQHGEAERARRHGGYSSVEYTDRRTRRAPEWFRVPVHFDRGPTRRAPSTRASESACA